MKNELLCFVRPFVSEDDDKGSGDLVEKAGTFLDAFTWAKRTGKLWIAECIPGVFGLFLVELEPSAANVDQYVWVIVGDLPPAYISTQHAKSPKAALNGYIAEMEAWVDAVEDGKPTDDFIPVNGAPTRANAQALKTRLEFLDAEILPRLRGRE